jgi:hypothetical protein
MDPNTDHCNMEMMPQTEKENPKMDNHHKIKLNYWNLS